MQWTMAEAKKDYERGLLTGYEFNDGSTATAPEWNLSFMTSMTCGCGVLVDARTKQTRAFRTLDAAVAAARAVGFQVNLVQGIL